MKKSKHDQIRLYASLTGSGAQGDVTRLCSGNIPRTQNRTKPSIKKISKSCQSDSVTRNQCSKHAQSLQSPLLKKTQSLSLLIKNVLCHAAVVDGAAVITPVTVAVIVVVNVAVRR